MNTNITGKKIFMTGATSGLGKIAVMHVAGHGANVIVLARNKSKAQLLIKEFKSSFPVSTGSIDFIEGNLNSFSSVVEACENVISKFEKIDIVVHNAGIMNFKPIFTEDGIEETLQVNLLSPMLINHILLPKIDTKGASKVIFNSSGLHQGDINFDNLEFKDNFSSFKVYRQSKLGVILLVRLMDKRLNDKNINFYSNHPGLVRTELGRNAGWFPKLFFWLMGKSPKKGAETLVYLLEKDKNELTSGEYYANKTVKNITPQSYDMDTADRLLKVTQNYLKGYLKNPSIIFPLNEATV